MSEQKMREQFEEWASEHYYLSELALERNVFQDDEYQESEVQAAWEAWSAAREALAVAPAVAGAELTGAEIDALKKDAARWRWVIQHNVITTPADQSGPAYPTLHFGADIWDRQPHVPAATRIQREVDAHIAAHEAKKAGGVKVTGQPIAGTIYDATSGGAA